MANLVGKVGSEESAQLSVWKLEVASCNFTTSVGEVGEVGSFEGLGRETEEVSQLSVWKLEFVLYFTHQLRKPQFQN